MTGWEVIPKKSVHISPIQDVVAHELKGWRCMCGPTVEAVKKEDGTIGFMVVHHALDGRE